MHFGAAESLRRLIGARKASADAKSRCHTFNSLSSIIIKKSFLMPKSLEIRTFTVITFCSQLRPDDFLFLLNFDNGAVFRQQTLVSLKKFLQKTQLRRRSLQDSFLLMSFSSSRHQFTSLLVEICKLALTHCAPKMIPNHMTSHCSKPLFFVPKYLLQEKIIFCEINFDQKLIVFL